MRGHKKINTKQYLINDSIKPPEEAKIRAKNMVDDETVIKVFVDASELNFQGVFGLGICIVGQGDVKVRSKKHYNKIMKTHIVYAELQSIALAIKELDKLVINKKITPVKIEVYSDCVIVDRLKVDNKLTSIDMINEVATEVLFLWEDFEQKHKSISLQIETMSGDLKRYNPFYKAAHNAARKSLNKS
ncbi:hypothetical protein IQ283_22570 [Alkalihalobacillus hwajinpoensis]|uniref:hypothetical protein n=1 Tax=Guptibacillus hwajinpoensis TaxID=208199 RepID=UPI00188331EC|nr:hypothetical protein [Pseudalkalibacillus hwajinpoensis]MBF0709385.1 hypothetical protein [Pseudalkalibacillus hwajinpoensis]